ncbi:MAG: SDR family oxidoreductase [Gammaproteobacteria bacterium]|nr:SDR family oxidoreductase [Gammaproteobacteria bacterium]
MARVLITGAGRGIGKALAEQYVAAGDEVIACVRDEQACEGLASDKARLQVLDVGDPESINAAREAIGDTPIDILINNAGAAGGRRQKLDDLDLDEWRRTLDVNTIGPILIARAFKSNLAASGNGKLMNVTSQLAASTWPFGGMYIYSSTKAALSRATQILAIDWKEAPITVALMHPGWVKTDMGGPNADITPEESAAGIISVIAKMTKADSGTFYKWNGEIHPW